MTYMLTKIRQHFLISFSLILLVYLFPIMLADIYFDSDLYRAISPHGYYRGDGRPLVALLYHLLGFGGAVQLDYGPFTQIVAGAFLVLAGLLLFDRYFKKEQPFMAAVGAFVVLASPYFVWTLIYRWDCWNQSLAVLTALTAAFVKGKTNLRTVLLSSLLILTTYTLYQSTVTVFIAIAVLGVLIGVKEGEKAKRLLLNAGQMALAFALGSFLYFKGLLLFFPVSGWVGDRATLLNPFTEFSLFWSNLVKLSELVSAFQTGYRVLFLLFFTVAFGYSLILLCRYLKKEGFGPYSLCVAFIVLFMPLILYINGISIVLFQREMMFESRYVVGLLGISLYIVLSFFWLARENWRFSWIKYALFVPALYLMLYCYSYVNALKAQQKFDNKVIGYVVSDLQNLDVIPKLRGVMFVGPMPPATAAKLIVDLQPMIVLSRHDWVYQSWKAADMVRSLKILNQQNIPMEELEAIRAKLSQEPVLKENNLYDIKIVDGIAVVYIKQGWE